MSDKVNYFIKDATERVLATAGELVAAVAAGYLFLEATGVLELDYQTLLAAGPLVLVAVVVKTLAASKIGDKGTAAIDRDPVRHVDTEFHADDYEE